MEQEAINLINTKREGSYWDFKEVHHANKAVLLHDILAMANSVTKSNKYIIFGVSDPVEGCEIKGVVSANRRSQTDIIDFLREKPFSGDNRPETELKTLFIDKKEIDVLTIFDHPNKPYYLTEDYRDRGKLVRANYIYTRNLDTNTPINKSADISLVEKMWRERFGLDLQPAERMVELLNRPDEWDRDVGGRAYHKYHPEFQVKFSETTEDIDVYSYFYINERSSVGTAYFRYLSTELFSLLYINCDETRVELAAPTNGSVRVNKREIWYMYYILESRQGAFLNFITNGKPSFESKFHSSPFVIYRDEEERNEFEHYLKNSIAKLDSIEDSERGLLVKSRIDKSRKQFLFKPVEMIKLVKLFEKWKS